MESAAWVATFERQVRYPRLAMLHAAQLLLTSPRFAAALGTSNSSLE